MFVKYKYDGNETPTEIIVELGKIQEGDENDLPGELKIEFNDTSAIFYGDGKLIGSFDIEHLWTFKDVLNKVIDKFEDGLHLWGVVNE